MIRMGLSTAWRMPEPEIRHTTGAQPSPMISCHVRTRERPADRPLDDLKEFSTTMASDINDLPATSPHGSDFGDMQKFLDFMRSERDTWHSNGTP